ncbi:hypothetical protein QTL97_10545 [Sporosarcina thermotolerans]|uniref:DUF2157 domain-containing protein n=1 Tax=Sporosarcina thermotolerans TaxID=633404 RepID=A0AAW9A8K5_9BACL|nr:hypothetical protein [Sporosarcina thermotolerans]MDW0117374.1 hypothetical protein [Sporosarcina thermotolerans]WHT47515.1 hypothetical protein QNH10_15290 [Sporosarcina thermotolerans]
MSNQRKKTIITEIKYWKENKLLPEHYCDYLITLYTQGEQEENINASDAILPKRKKKLNKSFIFLHLIYILSGLILLAVSLKVWAIYFEGQTTLLTLLLALNCLLWFVMGRLLKLIYFTISGVAGIIFIITFIVMHL